MILTRDESVEQNASNITLISVRSTFLMKKTLKKKKLISVLLYLSIESLGLFKPVRTFQSQTTGFYLA